jgi:hypothetical protein
MKVQFHSAHLFQESRCTLLGWNNQDYDSVNDTNPLTGKQGIRCHNRVASFFLKLLGKIHTLHTEDGKTVYLNKRSFQKWKTWKFPEVSSQPPPSSPNPTAIDVANTVQQTADTVLFPKTEPTPTIQEHLEEQVEQTVKQDVFKTVNSAADYCTPTKEVPTIEKGQDDTLDTIAAATSFVVSDKPLDNAEDDLSTAIVDLPKAVELPPLIQFLSTLSKKAGNDIAQLCNALFDSIDPDIISAFSDDTKHEECTLTFTQPVTFWIDSRDEKGSSYPSGGTIILIGHNQGSALKVSFEPEKSLMRFSDGFRFWCQTPLGVDTVEVVSIRDAGPETIEVIAGCRFRLIGLRTQMESKNKRSLIQQWKEATPLNGNIDYKEFLNEKRVQFTKISKSLV